jgi:hypothetical protein
MQSLVFGFLKTYLTLCIKSSLFISCPAVNVNLGFIIFYYYSIVLLSKVIITEDWIVIYKSGIDFNITFNYYRKYIVKLLCFKGISENTAVDVEPKAKSSF